MGTGRFAGKGVGRNTLGVVRKKERKRKKEQKKGGRRRRRIGREVQRRGSTGCGCRMINGGEMV